MTLHLNPFYLYFILVILRTAMLLKFFWQTIVFGSLYVVVYVAWYISSFASAIYMRMFSFIFNQYFLGVLVNMFVW